MAMGIYCVHYIEQKDCMAGLDAGGIWEIPFTKVNQVYSGCTSRTIQGRALGVFIIYSMIDTTKDTMYRLTCTVARVQLLRALTLGAPRVHRSLNFS